MIGKIDTSPQLEIFRVPLNDRVPADHPLRRLAGKVSWETVDRKLSCHYSPDKGRKAIPVRTMAGLHILKYIYGKSDAGVLRLWLGEPACQYFCGEMYLQEQQRFSRSDLTGFRKRIGEKGMKAVFSPELQRILEKMRDQNLRQSEKQAYSSRLISALHRLFHPKPVLKPL